jgi:hypothetical protein
MYCSRAVALIMCIQMNGRGHILWAWLIWPCKYEIASYGPVRVFITERELTDKQDEVEFAPCYQCIQ